MKAAKRASIRASIASVLGRAGPRPERKRGRDWDARGEAAGRVGPPPASGGAHSRQSLRRPWRGSLATRVQPRLRCKTWVMAATVLAIRTARPAVSAMSSQSFETSTPMHKGPARAERSVEADRRRATMTHLSQEGEGPLAQDCNSGWARPAVRAQTAKAGRRIEIACDLVFHPESISPSCPPFLPQTPSRQRTAGQHVQSRSHRRPTTPGSPRRFAPRDDGATSVWPFSLIRRWPRHAQPWPRSLVRFVVRAARLVVQRRARQPAGLKRMQGRRVGHVERIKAAA